MHHVAYTFASLEELFQRYVELKEKGVEPTMPIQHGMTTSLYYEDPDGNFVEMQVDNFASPDQATAYMYGPEFDGDPIGHAFSPEALLASLRAGVPAAELATRAWALAHPFESDREMPQDRKRRTSDEAPRQTLPDSQVVVVGAGPVGTALAVDLALAGIDVLVLESRVQGQRPRSGTNLTNIRSMERRLPPDQHARRAGVRRALTVHLGRAPLGSGVLDRNRAGRPAG